MAWRFGVELTRSQLLSRARGGATYGATEELGLAAIEERVRVPDWHATILHLLGMRFDELYLEINGLKEKLTGVNEAHVVQGILA